MNTSVKLRSLSGKIRVFESLINRKNDLIVWWYGGLAKNSQPDSQPRPVVFFREIDSSGNLGEFDQHRVALANIGLLRIGTVWRNGRCHSEAVFQKERFKVDFTDGAWKFVSPAELGQQNIINRDL